MYIAKEISDYSNFTCIPLNCSINNIAVVKYIVLKSLYSIYNLSKREKIKMHQI